jgi:NAD(P)-dependent dehydrogenase (short-subunit alcohol dehydrogenase family)
LNKRKTVLITGGTRGIGRGVVTKLVTNGWNVAFTYRSDQTIAQNLIDSLVKKMAEDQTIKAYPFDLSDTTAVNGLPVKVFEDFGGLNALINNAGLTDDGSFLSMDRVRWQRILSANFSGTASLSLAAIPYLLKSESSALVMVASLAGLTGKEGQVSYATSKGALIGLTQWLGRRYGQTGLRVNAVAPGFIHTEMIDILEPRMYEHILQGTAMHRMGTVDEVANTISFLLEPGYLQATTIRLDGGFKR